ncbi:hypothetical protein VTO73DRAFT_7555 [Trametes versicolor]
MLEVQTSVNTKDGVLRVQGPVWGRGRMSRSRYMLWERVQGRGWPRAWGEAHEDDTEMEGRGRRRRGQSRAAAGTGSGSGAEGDLADGRARRHCAGTWGLISTSSCGASRRGSHQHVAAGAEAGARGRAQHQCAASTSSQHPAATRWCVQPRDRGYVLYGAFMSIARPPSQIWQPGEFSIHSCLISRPLAGAATV